MSRTIWKFEVHPSGVSMDVPSGADILSVGVQDESIFAWALVDPDAPHVDRLLVAHPTGRPIEGGPARMQFIGTVQMHDGLVFHVFDEGEQAF